MSVPPPTGYRDIRLAIVQHGDIAEALRLRASGAGEPYFGMFYTLDTLDRVFAGLDQLIVSLNAPPYDMQEENRRLVSIPQPAMLFRCRGRWLEQLRCRQILAAIAEFRPTHLLLRTGGTILRRLLIGLREQRLSTLVICANIFAGRHDRATQRLVRELNAPHIFRIANHREPATQSMVDAGVDRKRVVAYDWPGQRLAEDYPPKILQADSSRFELLYVGTVSEDKGVGDVVGAIRLLCDSGLQVRLTAMGSGQLPSVITTGMGEDRLRMPGRCDNATVFAAMRNAHIVLVPSRHSFSEGFPFTLTEALASRTPVVVSDHPVFLRALQDGQGVTFARAADPQSLAHRIREVLTDPSLYRSLSLTTADALRRVRCDTTFGDLLDMWRGTF